MENHQDLAALARATRSRMSSIEARLATTINETEISQLRSEHQAAVLQYEEIARHLSFRQDRVIAAGLNRNRVVREIARDVDRLSDEQLEIDIARLAGLQVQETAATRPACHEIVLENANNTSSREVAAPAPAHTSVPAVADHPASCGSSNVSKDNTTDYSTESSLAEREKVQRASISSWMLGVGRAFLASATFSALELLGFLSAHEQKITSLQREIEVLQRETESGQHQHPEKIPDQSPDRGKDPSAPRPREHEGAEITNQQTREEAAQITADHFEADDSGGVKECETCCEVITPDNGVQLPCGRNYCAKCTATIFFNVIPDRSTWPAKCCDDPQCCRESGFPLALAAKALPPGILETYGEISKEMGDIHRIYCHDPHCANYLPECSEGDYERKCENCTKWTCTLCKKLYVHIAHECVLGDVQDEEAKFDDLAAEQGWATCGRCGSKIAHDGGCFHMTCKTCQNQFCYVCEETWRTCNCMTGVEEAMSGRLPPRVTRAKERSEEDMYEDQDAKEALCATQGHAGFAQLNLSEPTACQSCEEVRRTWLLVCRECGYGPIDVQCRVKYWPRAGKGLEGAKDRVSQGWE